MDQLPIDQRAIVINGVELNDAYYNFAPAWMRREYNAQRQANVIASQGASWPAGSDELEPAEQWRIGIEQFRIAAKRIEDPKIVAEMRDHLIAAIRKGTMRAYGVPEKPTPSQEYVEIAPAMLEPRFFKWSRNRIEDRNFAFRSVRVLKAVIPPKRPAKPTPPGSSAKPKASDVRRQLVIKSYLELKDDFRDNYTKADAIRAVVKYVKATYRDTFDGKLGLSRDTMVRYLDGQPGF